MHDFKWHLHQFQQYTQDYSPQDPLIRLKLIHTMQVVDNMKRLLQEEQIPVQWHEAALLCALYHDLGRFEQIRQYHTFIDAKSIPHADLSVSELKKKGFLEDRNPQEQQAILDAIAWHSLLELPASIPDAETETLARLIRDADKLDIFRVFATEDAQNAAEKPLEEILQESVTPAVSAALRAHRSVRKEDRKTSLDIWMTFLGFFYDFNYPASLQLALQQGWYRKVFDEVVFADPAVQQEVQELLAMSEAYARSRLEENRQKEPGQD